MAKNIQPPDPDRFRWEHHTAVVEPGWAQPFPQGVRAFTPPTERCSSQHRANTAGVGADDGFSSGDPVSTAGENFGVGGEPRERKGASDDADARRSFWDVVAAAAAAEDMAIPVSQSSAASLLEKVRDVGADIAPSWCFVA